MKTKPADKKDELPKLSDLPQPPAGAVFSFAKVERITFPHPYCITPRHVAYAADHCGGMLTTEAIRGAEKAGARCDICAKSGKGILTIDQHETSTTLFINVPQNRDLNAVEGLHNFLFTNKAKFESMGIQGFAFPTK